jgi:hypothetical protein
MSTGPNLSTIDDLPVHYNPAPVVPVRSRNTIISILPTQIACLERDIETLRDMVTKRAVDAAPHLHASVEGCMFDNLRLEKGMSRGDVSLLQAFARALAPSSPLDFSSRSMTCLSLDFPCAAAACSSSALACTIPGTHFPLSSSALSAPDAAPPLPRATVLPWTLCSSSPFPCSVVAARGGACKYKSMLIILVVWCSQSQE